METKLIIISLLLMLTSTFGNYLNNKKDVALKKATAFIDSRRPWTSTETPSAVLGLFSANPALKTRRIDPDLKMSLELAFIVELARNEVNPVNLDDSALVQFISAFQVACLAQHWPLKVDLVEELRLRVIERSENPREIAPSLPALVISICNQGRVLPNRRKVMHMLTLEEDCLALCLERAALNVIALNCLRKQVIYNEVSKRRMFKRVLVNKDRIKKHVDELKGQGQRPSFFATSLLLQASAFKSLKNIQFQISIPSLSFF